jgi:hypothetical protein
LSPGATWPRCIAERPRPRSAPGRGRADLPGGRGQRLAADARISREAAATRLFRERLPDRPVPLEPEATLDALADAEASPAHAPDLAARRLETLLAALKGAGVAPARLVDAPLAERRDSTEGAIELNLLEPDTPRRFELLRFLPGLGGPVRGGSQ